MVAKLIRIGVPIAFSMNEKARTDMLNQERISTKIDIFDSYKDLPYPYGF